MLVLDELSWGGCFSYGPSNKVKLNDANITQLIGENGAGKSSIALIIQEALFNKNFKNIKKADIPNRNGDGAYWIKLTFLSNGKHYEVHIDRKASLKIKLLEDGEDISSHTATGTFKSIEEIFGMDFKTFVPLMYQSTKEGLFFLTATDTNRKKFLIDLFGLSEYDTYHGLFKDLVSETTSIVSRLEGSVSSISTWIKKNENVPEPKDLVPIPNLVNNDELWSLKDRISKAKETNKRINDNNKYNELLKSISYDKDLVSQVRKDTSTINSSIGELTSEIKRLSALISKLKNLDDKCPTCEQNLDKTTMAKFINEANSEYALAVQKRDKLSEELSVITKMNTMIADNKAKQNEWESLYIKLDKNLPKALEDVEDIAYKVTEIEAEISRAKRKHDLAIQTNLEAEKHNSRISVIMEQLAEHEVELAKAKHKLKMIMDELSILEILKKAFSTNGLVAYKLENLVKDLEELANEYLAELSDGRFTLVFSISSDKLNVSLTDNGADIEVAALSNGELARVNTATLLAIRQLMNSISKTQVNVLFLDEMTDVLDNDGKEVLVEVLLKEKGLNTFLVSHGWSHPLLSKITVQKVDGNSELVHG